MIGPDDTRPSVMVADPIFFRDLAYVFGAAVLGALLARVTHQPLILAMSSAGSSSVP